MPVLANDAVLKLVCISTIAVFFIAIVLIRVSIKILPENKRVVMMRLGKIIGSRGPGIVLMIPFIDFAIWVDLQQAFHYKFSDVPTLDHRKITLAVALEGKVTDPEKSVLNVPNLENSLSKVIETEIIDIAGSKNRDELVQRRDWLEGQLKDVLYRSTKMWGFEVSRFVIDDIQ